MLERLYGKDSKETFETMDKLGKLFHDQGRFQSSEKIFNT